MFRVTSCFALAAVLAFAVGAKAQLVPAIDLTADSYSASSGTWTDTTGNGHNGQVLTGYTQQGGTVLLDCHPAVVPAATPSGKTALGFQWSQQYGDYGYQDTSLTSFNVANPLNGGAAYGATSDVTVFVVASITGNGGFNLLGDPNITANVAGQLFDGPGWSGSTTAFAAVPQGQYAIYGLSLGSSELLTTTVDNGSGVATTTVTPGNHISYWYAVTYFANIGIQGGGFNGNVAAIRAYQTALSAADMATVEQELFTKYLAVPTFLPGDADKNGVVDDNDLNALLSAWGTGTTWATGNFKGTGTTDDNDLNALLSNWGKTSGAPVPEPVTLSLLALGGLALLRRKNS